MEPGHMDLTGRRLFLYNPVVCFRFHSEFSGVYLMQLAILQRVASSFFSAVFRTVPSVWDRRQAAPSGRTGRTFEAHVAGSRRTFSKPTSQCLQSPSGTTGSQAGI